MDANEFGNYLKLIRDKSLSRPAMADKAGVHVNTIKAYEMDGRLPDVDYLAALAIETGHCFSDLINKRLLAGKLGQIAQEKHLFVEEVRGERGEYEVVDPRPTGVEAIPVLGSNNLKLIDKTLLPSGINIRVLKLFDGRHQTDSTSQVMLVNTEDKAVQDGQLFVIDIGNGAISRRVHHGLAGSLMLATDNPGMTPLTVPAEQVDNIVFLGRVVCAISYF
ncbi:MAG: XRE family transcriptional regulator [Arsukibacterium sp.]|nr:XRE family transcriptional regulator [Arsukibacterium sp.]